MDQPDKYLDKEYFILNFGLGRSISVSIPAEVENYSEVTQTEIEISPNAEEQNLNRENNSFVDEIIRSSQCIARLEERIERKSNLLMNLEVAIKILFAQNMILQKQILLSHDHTCDYMIEDLNNVSELLEKLGKPVGKARAEAEAAMWEKESEKTCVLMDNLKKYLGETLKEVFSNNYENLRTVPMFTILLSDNTSILHRQFFDHFSDLCIRGKMQEEIITNLHGIITQTQSDLHRKLGQLTEIANNIFHSTVYENRLTYGYNLGIEDAVENSNYDEENVNTDNNNNDHQDNN